MVADNVAGALKELEKARTSQAEKVTGLSQQLLEERAKLAQLENALNELQRQADPNAFRDDFQGLGIVEATERLLAESDHDLDTVEIANILLARGVKTTSKRFVPTVYATLTNADYKFVRRNGKWGLKRKVK